MSNVPAIPSGMPEGMEDIEVTDVTMPIFRIDHEQGVFVNSLTNEQFTEFEAVILGVIKQRILWPREVGDEGDQPMCRSYDFTHGFPRAETWVQVQPKTNQTAQKSSGFAWGAVEAAEEGSGLACADCALKEWGANREPPWCNEQWTMPFARLVDNGDPIVGVISFQRTGLKPCKSYVSGFVQAKAPLFTAVTKIKGIVQQRGTVSWVIPSFTRLRESNTTEWPMFSRTLHDVRDYLTTPRQPRLDPGEEAVQAATATMATASRPAPSQEPEPEPAPEPVTEETGQTPAPPRRAVPAQQATPQPPPAAYDPDEEPF